VTGYSGTPLPKKLGVEDDSRVVVLDPPPGFEIEGAPQIEAADVVVAFFTKRLDLERRIEPLAKAIFPNGGCWVAWPKKASGVETDITEDTIRTVALPLGLVDNKVCAIDDTWSGLRLVWRRERRG
jgi:hypothetical protein